ncbi:GDSL-type esterase/lipase family protein [Paenibacillus sp. CMAA1364]
MNRTNWIWRSVSLISIVTTVMLLVGFMYAVIDINVPQTGTELTSPAPSLGAGVSQPLDQKKEYNISAIGDSLAKGTGDDTGRGFVKRSVELLSDKSGKKTTLINNLGINGLTTTGLLAKLDEVGVQYVLKQSDIIILSIGGNDLFQGVQQVASKGTTKTESFDSEQVPQGLTAENLRSVLPTSSAQLQLVVEEIRSINPKAYIIYVGLYNPFSDIKQLSSIGNEVVSTWNTIAQTIVNNDKNMVLVPTYDLFSLHMKSYLASDHFHPNGDGYQQIANRIVQGIQ